MPQRSQPTCFLELQISTLFIIHTSKGIILLKILRVCLFFFYKRKVSIVSNTYTQKYESIFKFEICCYISYNTISLIQVEGVGTRNQSRGALLRWLTIHPQHKCKENSTYSVFIVWCYLKAIVTPKTELTIHKTLPLPQLMQKEVKKILWTTCKKTSNQPCKGACLWFYTNCHIN